MLDKAYKLGFLSKLDLQDFLYEGYYKDEKGVITQSGEYMQQQLARYIVIVPYDFTKYIKENPDYEKEYDFSTLEWTCYAKEMLPEFDKSSILERGVPKYLLEDPELFKQCIDMKESGNEFFKSGNFENALSIYN